MSSIDWVNAVLLLVAVICLAVSVYHSRKANQLLEQARELKRKADELRASNLPRH